MSQQLKMEEFLRTFPEKIEIVLRELGNNTKLLNQLKDSLKEFEVRLNKVERRTSLTELSTMIIN